jgi:hypothetical protein
MNLHEIVKNAIDGVNRHEDIVLWRCTGVENLRGIVTPIYEKKTLRGQIQRPSMADMELNEKVARAGHSIKCWLNAPADTINRNTQTAADFIERKDGTFWLIVAIRESYQTEGWLSVLAVEQLKKPTGVVLKDD